VFRIKVAEVWKTNQDRTNGYFVLGEEGYAAINIHTFLNFILV
jgi:hypothetical protein